MPILYRRSKNSFPMKDISRRSSASPRALLERRELTGAEVASLIERTT
jgi:hypothetical protein